MLRSPEPVPTGSPRARVFLAATLVLAALFPVAGPAVGASAPAALAPFHRHDAFEIRLQAPAATRARQAVQTAARRVSQLGVAAIDRAAARYGATFQPEFRGESPPADPTAIDFTAFYIVHLPDGAPTLDAMQTFASLGEVAGVHPIARLRTSVTPNDSLFASSPWFYQPAGRHDVHAPEAWDYVTGDTGIVVAILDTGVLPYHPDLGGRVAGSAGQIWTNWAEAAGAPNVDDDRNGFVDDVHGWDFVDVTTASTGEDGRDEDNDPSDWSGHGTAVAGLVGAITDNSIGVAGMAWNVRLMPLRMAWAEDGAHLGVVDMALAAKAIRYATRMGAQIINCSFETEFDAESGLEAAVRAATQAGVIIVNAAGNETPHIALASREDVVSVAATDASDRISDSSNLGSYVDVAAPGVDIASTFVEQVGADSIGQRQPSYVPSIDGTSFAAPLVSGALALYLARGGYLGMTPQRSTNAALRVSDAADDIRAQNPGVRGFGGGRLNAYNLIAEPQLSFASYGSAKTVTPAVVIPAPGLHSRVAYVFENGSLVTFVESGFSVAGRALPAPAVGTLAGADLGGGRGPALFVSVQGGLVAGYDGNLNTLPGWPVSTGDDQIVLTGGPALGDLDGDGVLEIVCGASDGTIWAWHADGTLFDHFFVTTDASGLEGVVALADLDGVPGVEIIAATQQGRVYAFKRDGTRLRSWPRTVASSPASPVVARLDTAHAASVVVAAQSTLYAFRPDGSQRFAVPLPGTVAQPPAAADLDGDGVDEIVVATAFPATIAVYDSAGQPWTSHGFPFALSGDPQGPPVVGPLDRVEESGAMGVFIEDQTGLRAITDHAAPARGFPKPGRAGQQPSIARLRFGSIATVVAGSGVDSSLFWYRIGVIDPARSSAWTTPRANFARTASTLDAPGFAEPIDLPPARVTDLTVVGATSTSVTLQWTSPADDGETGAPDRYEFHAASAPLDDANFGAAPDQLSFLAYPPAGRRLRQEFRHLQPATTYWFAMRSVDAGGQASAVSNTVPGTTRAPGHEGALLTLRRQPSRLPAEFDWQGVSGVLWPQTLTLYDLRGRRVRGFDLAGQVLGAVTWDGRDEEGHLVPAGLYFARLISGSVHVQARVVLVP